MNQKIIRLSIFFAVLFFGCEKFAQQPLVKDKTKPGELTNIRVVNIPGGAKITYTLPDDEDLLYVQANYTLQSGEKRAVKSSLYTNFVLIEGLADTTEHTIELFAVDKSENRSNPAQVKVYPETPPIQSVFRSINVQSDFGGINIHFENQLENEYVFNTFILDATGNWVRYDRLYTKVKERDYSIRGLPSQETVFGILVTDKWGNRTDTLKKVLTPIYEEKLDKKQWVLITTLPSDFITPYSPSYGIPNLWNDVADFGQTDPNTSTLPSSFTVDLGAEYKFSRAKILQYNPLGGSAFMYGNIRKFEIWGGNVLLDDWSDWTLLVKGESIKPSGLPYGQATEEDKAYAAAGEDYSFPLNAPRFRYIRFKAIETWAKNNYFYFDEMTLWGQK